MDDFRIPEPAVTMAVTTGVPCIVAYGFFTDAKVWGTEYQYFFFSHSCFDIIGLDNHMITEDMYHRPAFILPEFGFHKAAADVAFFH